MKVSLRNKVVGLAVLAALVPLAGTVTLTLIEKRPLQERVLGHMETFAQAEVEKTARQVFLMCKAVHEGAARHLLQTLNVAKEEIGRLGGVSFGKETVVWKARNQFTQKETEVSLPKLMVGEVWLGQNADPDAASPVVDAVTKYTQKFCTVFQRMNAEGDMIRVCTTVRNAKGQRAIGTYIPCKMPDGADNPVLAKVLKGERYSAMAQVVGKFQETVYEPIWKDADKKEIIGMVYAGQEMEDVLQELRDAIQSIVVGKSGYVCVIGAKGDQRGCYVLSKAGERNGENILDSRDARGRAIIKDIVDKALATPPGTAFFDQYAWQNKGEPAPRMKRVAAVYYEPWDWIIDAGVYDDEYHEICQNIENAIEKLISNIVITGGLSMAAAVILALLLGGAVAKPVRRIVHVAQVIARGDLAEAKREVAGLAELQAGHNGGDETAQMSAAIVTMTSHLASLVGQVQRSCVQLVSASTQIAATSKEQEATVGEFEALTARIVTAVKEISVTAQELARTMEGVKGTAEGTRQLADSGRIGLGEMEGAMKQLAVATTSISSKLSVISEKAGNINSVVTTITKVADQTNLLSLNAAIEAEKAGEYGLGFAVVAREIRRLADQTAVATLDIETMVKEMQRSVTVGVMEMDKFSEEVKRGVRSVGEISGQLGQIIEKVKEVTGQFERVNEGMKAQSQGAEQISEAMLQLSVGAKQTSESVKQSNEATEQLREAARALQTETSRFKV